jgi:hypothetical protein
MTKCMDRAMRVLDYIETDIGKRWTDREVRKTLLLALAEAEYRENY